MTRGPSKEKSDRCYRDPVWINLRTLRPTVAELINHILNDLIQGEHTLDGFELTPEHATVCIVKGKHPEETDKGWPSNYLHVSINMSNEYGAVRWFSTKEPENTNKGHVSRFVWFSEN
jgi:hypothetical protein